MRSTLLAVAALLFTQMTFATPAEDIAARFVDVLRQDNLARLTSLVDEKESDPHAWDEVRNLVNRFDCMRIDRYEATLESSTEERIALRVELEGSAELKAVWRPERRLPRIWHIEARRVETDWRISRAFTEERRIAMAMVAARTPFDAERLLRANFDADEPQVIRLYADELTRGKDITRFEHALALARSSGDVATEVDVLRAHAAALVAEPVRMLPICREAERVARQSGDRDDLARALLTLGAAQWMGGDREGARNNYAAIADMVDVLDDPTTSMKAVQMIVFLNGTDVSPLKAMKAVDRQFELAARYQWEEAAVLALCNRADVHFSLGNVEVARADTVEALRLSRLQGNRRFESMLIVNLAMIAAGELRYEESARRFREALEVSIDDAFQTIDLLTRLAGVEQTLGHSEEAENLLRRAESLHVQHAGQRAGIDEVRGRIQRAQGHEELAVKLFQAALDTLDSEARDDLAIRTQILEQLGDALAAVGREAEALDVYRTAVANVELRRNDLGADAIGRSAFLTSFITVYEALVESLVQRGAIDEAFSVAEQMRARGLREAIDESGMDRSALLTADEKASEASLVARVVELNKAAMAARKSDRKDATERQLADARIELDRYRIELRIAHPAIARRRLDRAPALQLPAGSESLAFIEYVIGKSDVIAFVVVSGAPIRAVRLPTPRETLERDARELEQLLEARSPAYARQAMRMYAELLAPLEPYVRGRTTLAIAPDGLLWTVPFHALVGRDDRYVVDHYSLFYAHSLSLLRDASALHAATPPGLLALGNPIVGGDARATVRSAFRDLTLGPLVEAEAEVRSIASLYSPRRRRVYTRGAASETVFKEEAPRVGVIHVAAHALVDDRAPMYSAIVLATQRNGDDDGLLEAREIVDLQLNAELTVLSACQTARGKIGSGEGVIGLSWALFAAGCPTTVVSQWDAESAATASLMVELHRRLQAGDTTAAALRKAQASVRRVEAWRHPFYWAPFIALGAADRPLTTR
jgi:CHAT domain-containing protein/predicted negative regulator of RcsB-dependent stress response